VVVQHDVVGPSGADEVAEPRQDDLRAGVEVLRARQVAEALQDSPPMYVRCNIFSSNSDVSKAKMLKAKMSNAKMLKFKILDTKMQHNECVRFGCTYYLAVSLACSSVLPGLFGLFELSDKNSFEKSDNFPTFRWMMNRT
jgi:hypothetical protein